MTLFFLKPDLHETNFFVRSEFFAANPRKICVEVEIRKCVESVDECGIQFLNIPQRSPDINAIENIFHNIRLALRKEAMERKICKETYAEFKQRIKKNLKDCDISLVDNTIGTVHKRLQILARNKGYRTKY